MTSEMMGHDGTWEGYYHTKAFPEEFSLQRGGNVSFIIDQCCKEGMDSEVFSKVLLEVSCHL